MTAILDEQGYAFDVERKRVVKHDQERALHAHPSRGRFRFEATLYAADQGITSSRAQSPAAPSSRARIHELERFLEQEYPGIDLDETSDAVVERIDRFEIYRMLLKPLEKVEQNPTWHPEGDALYHTLQVFELARIAPV